MHAAATTARAAWAGATAAVPRGRGPRVNIARPSDARKSSRSLWTVMALCLLPLYVLSALALLVVLIVVRDVVHLAIRASRALFVQKRVVHVYVRHVTTEPPSGPMDPVNRLAKIEPAPAPPVPQPISA